MILNENKSGFFSFCDECNEYHIQFNNIFITLTENKLERFKNYVREIEPSDSLIQENECVNGKKIILPLLHPYMVILIDNEELEMLKKLILLDEDEKDFITYKDFPFEINNN